MRRNNTVSPLLWAALTLPVLYLAALLASGYEEGMTVFDLMGHFSELMERPLCHPLDALSAPQILCLGGPC